MQVQQAKLIASHMSIGMPFLDVQQLLRTAAEDLRHEAMFGVSQAAWL